MPKILVIEEIWDTYFGIRLRFSLKNPKKFWKYNIVYIFIKRKREKKGRILDLDAIVLQWKKRKRKNVCMGKKEKEGSAKFIFFWFF